MDTTRKIYAVTDQVYNGSEHRRFDHDMKRRFTLPQLAAYIKRWAARERENAPNGPASTGLSPEVQMWTNQTITTLYVYSLNWEIWHVFVYADRNIVGCDDGDLDQGEYAYLCKALES